MASALLAGPGAGELLLFAVIIEKD